MQFKIFANFLDEIENTKSRNEIAEKVSNFLKNLDQQDIKPVSYMLTGKIKPDFLNIEFNFSEKQIINTIIHNIRNITKQDVLFYLNTTQSRSNNTDYLQNLENYLRKNNIDEAIYQIRQSYNINSNELTIQEVYKKLLELSQISGKGSQEKKSEVFFYLFKNLDPLSIKHIIRIIIGKTRTGLSNKTLIDAISMLITNNKSLSEQIEYKFGILPDIGEITERVTIGIKSGEKIEKILENIKPQVLVPILPKLVEREESSQKAFERIPISIVQPKLDGLRGQIHIKNREVKIYSRNLEDLTEHFPEIVESTKELFKTDSAILDSEIIGYDLQNKKFLEYQQTMTRRRKYEVDKYKESVPVVAMCFDLLFYKDIDLTNKPLNTRIKTLQDILKNKYKSRLLMLETVEIRDLNELENYFNLQLNKNLEGIIIKDPDSTYEPGTRNYKWIKLKANTVDSLVDTIDVTVMGYYYGKGSRNKFGFGALLVGIWDEEKEEYTSLAKLGSGFTEDNIETLYQQISKLETKNKPNNYNVSKDLFPDVWVEPKLILEIIADEITLSPIHTTAQTYNLKQINENKGLSVRFPRFKRIRTDKNQPTTTKEIINFYNIRKSKKQ